MSEKRRCKKHRASNLVVVIWDVGERRFMVTTFPNENLSAAVQNVLYFWFLNANFLALS